jgi:predicted metalloprotease
VAPEVDFEGLAARTEGSGSGGGGGGGGGSCGGVVVVVDIKMAVVNHNYLLQDFPVPTSPQCAKR